MPAESTPEGDTAPLNPETLYVIGQHRRAGGDVCRCGGVTLDPSSGDVMGMTVGNCNTCGDKVLEAPKGWIAAIELT